MKLSDIGKIVAGGTPKTKVEEYWNGDIPWITPKDLSSYTNMYILKGERSITTQGLNNSSVKLLPKGTVLFTSRAPIGYVAIAKDKITTNQGFKNIIVNAENHNIFIYYLLKNNIGFIENYANGSTFKEISGNSMKNLEFNIPPLPEQKAIANILSTLDEKIEINNKINKTLEDMASAIFKQWFVDFEFPCLPEKAGEPYDRKELMKVCTYKRVGGLPEPAKGKYFLYVILNKKGEFNNGITSDLYRSFYEQYINCDKENKPVKIIHYEEFNTKEEASKREKELKTEVGQGWLKKEYSKKGNKLKSAGEMVESELGMIPKGWEVKRLGDTVQLVKESTKAGEHLKNRKYNPIDTLPMKSIAIKEYKNYSEAKSSLILFEKYDILVGAMRVYFHRVNIAPYKGITRTTTFVIRSKLLEEVPFNLMLLNQEKTIDFAEKTSKGTTMPYAIWNNGLGEMLYVHPTENILKKYSIIIWPMLEKIILCSKENQNLRNLRDTLLPKLMSGEIRVPLDEK